MIQVRPKSELQKAREAVTHPSTNESLWGIIAGLNPVSTDRIAAIAGSGDQAFALLASGAEVIAVDKDPAQIEYVRLRARALTEGNDEAFLEGLPLILRRFHSYFDIACLDRIRGNIGRLTLAPAENIMSYTAREKDPVTKVYLSNCLDGRSRVPGFEMLKEISRPITLGGLIYSAENDICQEIHAEKLKLIGLEYDEKQTHAAHEESTGPQRGLIDWRPKVYKKVANPKL